jgi:Fe-Mn family superoxide dismutase
MSYTLPELPYAMDALAPVMSADTLEHHYGKHHRGYLDNLNRLAGSGGYAGLTLEATIREAHGRGDTAVFNNAAQVWNHTHFWDGMRPQGGGAMPGTLEAAMRDAFGSLAGFAEAFKSACLAQFGSGWAWLVFDGATLAIAKTGNAGTPLTEGHAALLTCDVWEHAYYIDHRNLRARYVDAFLAELVDWERVAARYAAATGRG